MNKIVGYAYKHGLNPKKQPCGTWTSECPANRHEHDTQSPACHIGPGAVWHCKKCGTGGGLADMLMAVEGLTLAEAMCQLEPENGARALPRTRALSPLAQLAQVRGWAVKALEALGVVEEGQEVRWPMRDHEGQITGWSRRRGDGTPFAGGKKNMFLKGSKHGFFMPWPLPEGGPVLIVEGEADATAAMGAGYQAVIGTPGATPAKAAIKSLCKLVAGKKVILCPDPDEPGAGWLKALGAALSGGAKVWYIPQGGGDLDKRLKAGESLADLIGQAIAWKDSEAQAQAQAQAQGAAFFEVSESGKKTFIPMFLAEAIMATDTFKNAPDGLLYRYEGGVYRPGGEKRIKAQAQGLLGKDARAGRKSEVVGYIEDATYSDFEEPLKDRGGVPVSVNCQNGVVDWRTGQLQAHSPARFELIQIPVGYEPGAKCPTFEAFLESTFPGDRDSQSLALEIMGFCLIPYTRPEKAFLLVGGGSNGKGVYIDTLTALVGADNTSSVALQDLDESRFKAAELHGRLLNTFADLPARPLKDAGTFKSLVTGDFITAEKKGRNPFKFRNFARLIFSCNALPLSLDRSKAFYRRLVILPFEQTFEEGGNRRLREELRAELPGILQKALGALQELSARDWVFTVPGSSKAAMAEYQLSNDTVEAFCSDNITLDPGGLYPIPKATFRERYEEFCREGGYQPMSDRRVKESLLRIYPKVVEVRMGGRGEQRRSWVGIRWVEAY